MAKIKHLGLVLALFLWVGLVCAQKNSDSSQSPVNLRPFQLTLSRDHLFGDWYGMRSELEEKGFVATLSFVTDIAGNPIGGRDQGVTHGDNLFDLEKLAGLKRGSFLVSMSQRSGTSLSMEYVGNAFTVQQVYGGQTFHLIDLACQHALINEVGYQRNSEGA